MRNRTLAFVIVAVIGGFIGGFWFANSINRSAIGPAAPVSTANKPSANTAVPGGEEPDLSEAEIRAKIGEADKNADNFTFQKELGIALYHYAAIKQEPGLLPDAARILARANSLNANDFDVLVAYGNARFDIGFQKKSTEEFQAARDIYTKALKIKPGDLDVQTDLGLTYYFQQPPAYDRAQAELQKVLTADPRHDRSLQYLVRTLIKQNKLADADAALSRLRSIVPASDVISELTTQLNSAKSGAGK
jgi:tetratricopeptide (TPR) repeat protein